MTTSSYSIKKLNNKLDSLIKALNGAKGSGNFGHAGRPGKVGGSGPGNGMSTKSDSMLYDTVKQMADIFTTMNKREGYKYSSSEDLVLKQGKFFTPEKRPENIELGSKKECFANASKLALERSDLTYVEGYAMINDRLPLPIAHAWCVDKKGRVIDNTWEKPGVSYFGVPFKTSYLAKKLSETGVYGILSGSVGTSDFLKDGVPSEGIASIKKQKNAVVVNGGKGSGNFGHTGRPGEVGGSSSSNWSHNPSEKDPQNEFDRVDEYCLPKKTADKLPELKQINTYSKIEKFLSDRGISIDTDVKDLKGKYKDEVIDSPSDTFVRLAIGIEAYRDKFGNNALKSLKKVKFYDKEETSVAAYYYSELGEKEPKEGQISFSQWDNTGKVIFHELAHAYQDSHKREGEDAVTYSNRVVKEAKLSDKATAYTGAGASGNGKGMEAERFADSFARGFSYGNKEDLDFIDRVAKLENKKKNFVEEPLTNKVNQLIHKINEVTGKKGNPYHDEKGRFASGPSSSGKSGSKSSIIEKGGMEGGYIIDTLDEFDDDQLSKLAENPIANLSEKRLKEVASIREKMYSTKKEFDLANQWLLSIVGNGADIMQKAKDLDFDPSKEIKLSRKIIGDKEVTLFRNQEGEFDKKNYKESRWGDIPHSHSSSGNDYTIKGNKNNILIHPEVLYSANIDDSYYRNEREYVVDNSKIKDIWQGVKL